MCTNHTLSPGVAAALNGKRKILQVRPGAKCPKPSCTDVPFPLKRQVSSRARRTASKASATHSETLSSSKSRAQVLGLPALNSRSLWCFIEYRSHARSPHEESLRLRGDSSRVGCGAGHCNLDTCTSVSGRALSCRFAVLGARTGLCFALQRGGGVGGWGERGDDDDVVTQTARTLSPRERFTRYL